MAQQVVMPKMGNSVESCILVEWKKKAGDQVQTGEVLCIAETDKATVDVESTAEGTVLSLLYEEGDDVPVMVPIAVVGEQGEAVPTVKKASVAPDAGGTETSPEPEPTVAAGKETQVPVAPSAGGASPRARNKAAGLGIPLSVVTPTGPKGRIIERDVTALAGQPLSPAAREAALANQVAPPRSGSGPGGRVLASDLQAPQAPQTPQGQQSQEVGPTKTIPVAGVRKITARRMMESIQQTCQLTLHSFADATALKRMRASFKASDPAMGLSGITIGDLLLFALTRTLPDHPELNAHFLGDRIVQYEQIHLGLATDTPRGLLVPVIRNARSLSLSELSAQAKLLAGRSREGKASADELKGSTITLTNVGAMGVESFTPVLNIPEVAILGVGNIALRPVEGSDGEVSFRPHIGLSLTIDHQAVDGADGARFLQHLAKNIANIDLLIAT